MNKDILQKLINSFNPLKTIVYWYNPSTNRLLSDVLYKQKTLKGYYKASLSNQDFIICMQDFCQIVHDEQVYNALKTAIASANPIQNFENYFLQKKHLQKQWHEFKNNWLSAMVKEFIEDFK